MNTTSTVTTVVPAGLGSRVLNEGYGPGAWHGADLKAALDGVTPALAFWRPAQGRHSIAEIALHHAYCTRGVLAQISGAAAEPFVVEGDDWFELSEDQLTWPMVLAAVDSEQRRLAAHLAAVDAGTAQSPLPEAERFTLTLGITCHAIYHAGQIQLIKRLRGE